MSLLLLLTACSEMNLGYMTSDVGMLEPEPEPELDTGAESCDAETPVSLYLSPDDSNSMSSPVQARERRGGEAGSTSIRTYEFFNYYRFAYAPPEAGTLGVEAALLATDLPGTYELQLAVVAPAKRQAERDPMNLTFSIDTSGSMGGEPLDLVRYSGAVINSQLQAGDVVSMVTWSDGQNVVLESHVVTGPSDPVVAAAFASLTSDGSTNLTAGLTRGYELATANFSPARINRVVLMSDGGANTGITDDDLIAAKAGDEDDAGIYMVGVGVGEAGGYNDTLMDKVTDAGKGAAVFIPSRDEAVRMFGERFLETFDVAARSVQLRLDLPAGFEIERFSGEEYSEDPREVEPQNLAPNDTVVLYQTITTCAPEAVTDDTPITVEVGWLDPITFAHHTTSMTWTFGELLAAADPQLAKGRAIYFYAEWLKGTAGDPSATTALDPALAYALALNPGDADLVEIQAVVRGR